MLNKQRCFDVIQMETEINMTEKWKALKSWIEVEMIWFRDTKPKAASLLDRVIIVMNKLEAHELNLEKVMKILEDT